MSRVAVQHSALEDTAVAAFAGAAARPPVARCPTLAACLDALLALFAEQ